MKPDLSEGPVFNLRIAKVDVISNNFVYLLLQGSCLRVGSSLGKFPLKSFQLVFKALKLLPLLLHLSVLLEITHNRSLAVNF